MPDTKHCPFCNEIIKAEAIKCRFCGEFLTENNPEYIKIIESKASATEVIDIIHQSQDISTRSTEQRLGIDQDPLQKILNSCPNEMQHYQDFIKLFLDDLVKTESFRMAEYDISKNNARYNHYEDSANRVAVSCPQKLMKEIMETHEPSGKLFQSIYNDIFLVTLLEAFGINQDHAQPFIISDDMADKFSQQVKEISLPIYRAIESAEPSWNNYKGIVESKLGQKIIVGGTNFLTGAALTSLVGGPIGVVAAVGMGYFRGKSLDDALERAEQQFIDRSNKIMTTASEVEKQLEVYLSKALSHLFLVHTFKLIGIIFDIKGDLKALPNAITRFKEILDSDDNENSFDEKTLLGNLLKSISELTNNDKLPDNIFIGELPPVQLNNLLLAGQFSLAEDEEPLILVDNTELNSCKNGILITSERILWNNGWGQKAEYVKLEELQQITLVGNRNENLGTALFGLAAKALKSFDSELDIGHQPASLDIGNGKLIEVDVLNEDSRKFIYNLLYKAISKYKENINKLISDYYEY